MIKSNVKTSLSYNRRQEIKDLKKMATESSRPIVSDFVGKEISKELLSGMYNKINDKLIALYGIVGTKISLDIQVNERKIIQSITVNIDGAITQDLLLPKRLAKAKANNEILNIFIDIDGNLHYLTGGGGDVTCAVPSNIKKQVASKQNSNVISQANKYDKLSQPLYRRYKQLYKQYSSIDILHMAGVIDDETYNNEKNKLARSLLSRIKNVFHTILKYIKR